MWEEFQENRDRFGFSRAVAAQTGQLLGAQLMEQGLGSLRGAVGTPAQIRALVRRYEEAGVDQLIFVSQAGRNRHEHICESLELFAREVMPEFHERADARSKSRRPSGWPRPWRPPWPARAAPPAPVTPAPTRFARRLPHVLRALAARRRQGRERPGAPT